MTANQTIPPRMDRLPRNDQGYVVPWFVGWVDGRPDFRVIGPDKIVDAIRFQLCWLCGQTTGSRVAFVIGPMCAINRNTAEPPCHVDCAEYAAQVCPFLTNPNRRRRESRMPDGVENPAGDMIRRNPGVSLLWITKATSWRLWRPGRGDDGVLFDIGDPVAVEWWAHGREATRDEVVASIESGMPILLKSATDEGERAVAALRAKVSDAERLLPAAALRGDAS